VLQAVAMKYIYSRPKLMNKIFILKKARYITGPFSIEQLIQSGLKSTDKVWYEGMIDWQPASVLQQHGITILEVPATPAQKTRSLFFWKKSSIPNNQ
jgi:hypothetical protein